MPSDTSMREKLDFLVRATGRAESQIVAEALEAGLTELSKKEALDAYLAGTLTRDGAISLLGEETVREWEFARKAIEHDVRWGVGT